MPLFRIFCLFILLSGQPAMAEMGHVTLTMIFSENGKYSDCEVNGDLEADKEFESYYPKRV